MVESKLRRALLYDVTADLTLQWNFVGLFNIMGPENHTKTTAQQAAKTYIPVTTAPHVSELETKAACKKAQSSVGGQGI